MNPDHSRTLERIGTGGRINGYDVLVLGDVVVIARDGTERTRRRVDGLSWFVANARTLKLGWGQFPDDAEVIYLYDQGDDSFGYAVNLDWPDGSEWGYAPFSGEAPDRRLTTGAMRGCRPGLLSGRLWSRWAAGGAAVCRVRVAGPRPPRDKGRGRVIGPPSRNPCSWPT
jgi:hypothetical protein